MNTFNVTIGQDKKQVFINVYYNNKRYRFWNGKAIEVDLRCIDNPSLLKAAFELKLRVGWRPKSKNKEVKETPLTVVQALNQGVETKISQGCSERFIKDAKRIAQQHLNENPRYYCVLHRIGLIEGVEEIDLANKNCPSV